MGLDCRRIMATCICARVPGAVNDPLTPILLVDRSILSDQSVKYVLVVNKDKVVQRVDIEPASRLQETGLRAVEGLKGDELIIVEGVNRVRPGMTVAVKGDPVPMPRRPVAKK